MSDDLDDGEIPKEPVVSRFALTCKGDKIDRWEPSNSTPRNRYTDEPRWGPPSAEIRETSRSGLRSPVRDDGYVRRRTRSPRGYDRYTTDSSTGGPRARYSGPRKQPSVHDANTKADLGRLAREAEAAAYKAKTLAAAKAAISPLTQSQPDTARVNGGRKRSRSPPALPHASSVSSTSRSIATHNASNSTDNHSQRLSRDRRPSSPTRIPREDVRPLSSPSAQHLTPADIARLKREKEAAAYKARVLQEAQKLQPRLHNKEHVESDRDSIASKSLATSNDGRCSGEHELSPSRDETVKTPETVVPIFSSTTALDIQVMCYPKEHVLSSGI